MKFKSHNPSGKIRGVIICFSLFVALMLFQTDFMRLGTITASVTLLMTIVAYFFQNGTLQSRIIMNKQGICLAVFLLYTVMITLISGYIPSGFVRYISQIVLCLVLFSVTISERENDFLKKVFAISAAVYAVLIIHSLYENAREGYIHTDIQIFNTAFDPNFVGIPLTAATALLLNNVLMRKRMVWSLILYALIAGAIIYTASRGSFVALLVSNGLGFLLFLMRSKLKASKKALYLVLPILAFVVLANVFKELFPVEWQRLSNISAEEDSGRLALWKTAIEDWWKSPVFGNGLGYAYRAHMKATHNTYLQILSETGLIGAILMGCFMLSSLWKAYKADTTLFCALAGVLVQILFLDALDNRCLWILLCWIVMLPNRKKGVSRNEKTNSPVLAKTQTEET